MHVKRFNVAVVADVVDVADARFTNPNSASSWLACIYCAYLSCYSWDTPTVSESHVSLCLVSSLPCWPSIPSRQRSTACIRFVRSLNFVAMPNSYRSCSPLLATEGSPNGNPILCVSCALFSSLRRALSPEASRGRLRALALTRAFSPLLQYLVIYVAFGLCSGGGKDMEKLGGMA